MFVYFVHFPSVFCFVLFWLLIYRSFCLLGEIHISQTECTYFLQFIVCPFSWLLLVFTIEKFKIFMQITSSIFYSFWLCHNLKDPTYSENKHTYCNPFGIYPKDVKYDLNNVCLLNDDPVVSVSLK